MSHDYGHKCHPYFYLDHYGPVNFCHRVFSRQNEFDKAFFVSLFLITAERLVIFINAWTFPLANIARRRTIDKPPYFDIYLLRTLAKFSKEIFSAILFIILLMYVYNLAR
jgi:hypothetical protein